MRSNRQDPHARRTVKERDIEEVLVETVKLAGGEVRKVKWIGRNGAPDRCVMLPEFGPVFVEVKAPGEKLEPHQAREHARMRKNGVLVTYIDSIAQAVSIVSHIRVLKEVRGW